MSVPFCSILLNLKISGMRTTTMMITLSLLPLSTTMDMEMIMERKGQELTTEGQETWREVKAKI